MLKRVLVIGNGAREHTLAYKLAQSQQVEKIWVCPGNGGTAIAGGKITNIEVSVKDVVNEFVPFLKLNGINLVVVGPEVPLADGISNDLKNHGIPCFGPSQKAAQLESSKAFSKSFMDKYNIPTARWQTFQNYSKACEYITNASYPALVVKASGLAAGKGVIVAKTKEEACIAVQDILEKRIFGDAGNDVVVEELLEGEEVSVLAFSDGKNILLMPPSQDHKRLLEGDEGPNTGGMGAYCPCPLINKEQLDFISKNVILATINGAAAEGFPFVGVLYAGLMLTQDGPRVLEFNCRFGDPETQCILPLLKSDLYDVMMHCVNGTLAHYSIEWFENMHSVGVVVASQGYPNVYSKDKEITGLDVLSSEGLSIFHAGTKLDSGKLLSSGGRVLTVVSVSDSLKDAADKAINGASRVIFEGAFFRKDIAYKGIAYSPSNGLSYASAGVNILAGNQFVECIKSMVQSTDRPGADVSLGGFGGCFDLKAANFSKPILIASTHGVGTKMKLAEASGSFRTIGIDLVALCVNDLLTYAAEPLFFLDYIACGKLDLDYSQQLLSGIVDGCKKAGCALIGGETAEMPGMYSKSKFDIAGFAIGACHLDCKLPFSHEFLSNDVLLGISSSGVHCNGINLLVKLMEKYKLTMKHKAPWSLKTLEEELLTPTAIYVSCLLPLLQKKLIKQCIHISGKGLQDCLSEGLKYDLGAVLDAKAWTLPPLCSWLIQEGISSVDIIRVFNCGIGMVLIVSKDHQDYVIEQIEKNNFSVWNIGHLKEYKSGQCPIEVINWNYAVEKSIESLPALRIMESLCLNLGNKKVCVLISGDALTLKFLIKYCQRHAKTNRFTIDLVVSNNHNSTGLKYSQDASISTKVIDSTGEEFEKSLNTILNSISIDILCLIDCNHTFSDNFIRSCQSKIIKSHLSLLPSFPDLINQQEVLDAGVIFAGCTLHFVVPSNHNIAYIQQGIISVEPSKTSDDLAQRVQALEYKVYPEALEKVAGGLITLSSDFLTEKNNPVVNSDIKANDQLYDVIATVFPKPISDKIQDNIQTFLSRTFYLQFTSYDDPLLISGTDGVGTKLLIAQACHIHHYVGIDLVAMCVNDILTHGAEPLFFLSYLACGFLEPYVVKDIMSGIIEGCRLAECPLIDAPVTELPCTYSKSEYDLAGFSLGVVERKSLIPCISTIQSGDAIIALPSSGVHSNGFSLVRRILCHQGLKFTDAAPWSDKMIGEELLVPTKIYVSTILAVLKSGYIKACAHITGGGLLENIPRVLPKNLGATLNALSWKIPAVFAWLWNAGKLSEKELAKTFNCGLGMILIIDQGKVDEVQKMITLAGEKSFCVGNVTSLGENNDVVDIKNLSKAMETVYNNEIFKRVRNLTFIKRPTKVGVLISGTGTNLQALIDFTQNPLSQNFTEIVLVVSNIENAEGLKKAEKANIPTLVISHKSYSSRESFDMAVNEALLAAGVKIICLAGFMRILSAKFVQQWNGKILNTHPALLPAFKGMHAQKQALLSGVPFAGCSIHFVAEEVDAGAVIHQAVVKIEADDTEESLTERIKLQEHRIFPLALEMVASGKVKLDPQTQKLTRNY